MSQNKSKTSLLTIAKNMSPSQNVLKNKDRFTKTESIDTKKSQIRDISDISIALNPKLDEDVSNVLDLPKVPKVSKVQNVSNISNISNISDISDIN